MIPNIFRFATSELSQDAALCWLISWAAPENEMANPDLGRLARRFIDTIFQLSANDALSSFESVEVRRQQGGIDILCILNKDIVVLIEDKVGTQEHSDQLSRYMEFASTSLGFVPRLIIPAYVQTGDQSDYSGVIRAGYAPIGRSVLLSVLESDIGKDASAQSDILKDFTVHLRDIENRVESYAHLELDRWLWDSWKGLFSRLQVQIEGGRWGYVPNASGGFLGFWFHFREDDDCEIYLQLEQDRLCFKISVDAEDQRGPLRDLWHKKIIEQSDKYGLEVRRPNRFGHGQVMTVAILDADYRKTLPNGLIDLARTIETMLSAQEIIDACLTELPEC